MAAVALVGSLIERASSSDARRWALVRGWLIAEAIALAVVATVCLGRGRSESALAIIGGTVVWIGVGVLLLDKVQASSVVAPHGRAFCFRAVPRQGTPVHFRRARAWCLATVVVAVGPLQYAGALVDDPFMSKIAAVLTAGELAPLNPRSGLRTGQCLMVRSPKARNATGPCGLPHKAQVVAVLNPRDPCPALDEFETHGQNLELVRVALQDDVAVCLLRSHEPTRDLTEAFYKKGLAPTL